MENVENEFAMKKVWQPCGSLWRPPASPSLARCSSCPGLAPHPQRRRSRRRAGGRRLSCSGWTRGRRRGRRGGGQSPSSFHFPLSIHSSCFPLAALCSVVLHGGCPLQSAQEESVKKCRKSKDGSTCVISVTG